MKDLSVEEIRRVWDGQLEPVSSDLLPLNLPSTIRGFLTAVGLPAEVLNIRFIHDERLTTPIRRGDRKYLVFAEDTGHSIFVVDLKSEYVYRTHKSQDRFTKFYNSSLAYFVYFHGLLQKNVLSLQLVTKKLLVDAVNSVWNPLQELDPQALEEDAPWTWTLSDLLSEWDAEWDAEQE